MQNVVKWKLRGIDNYGVTKEGDLIRSEYVTKNHQYKNKMVLTKNSRNQYTLYRNGLKEYWSEKQLRNILIKL